MRRYLLLGLGGLMLMSLGVHLASCNEVPATAYGNPNTLDRRSLPGEGGAEPLSCTGDAAAAKFDGGTCPSFASDIFPLLTPTGPWRCTDTACHGGATSPPLKGASAAECYASLQAATVGGKPYIPGDGGAKDPDPVGSTTILCNLQGGCGTRMPQTPGKDPTTSELCMIQAWLKCGAPK